MLTCLPFSPLSPPPLSQEATPGQSRLSLSVCPASACLPAAEIPLAQHTTQKVGKGFRECPLHSKRPVSSAGRVCSHPSCREQSHGSLVQFSLCLCIRNLYTDQPTADVYVRKCLAQSLFMELRRSLVCMSCSLA